MMEITIQGSSWAHIRAQMIEAMGGPPVPGPSPAPKSEADTPAETAQADGKPAARGRGRPSNAEKAAVEAKAAEAEKANGKAPAAEPEPEASRKEGPPSREEVVAALQTYADANGGQPAAREVMKKVTGHTRLIDCQPADYAKLVEALTGF